MSFDPAIRRRALLLCASLLLAGAGTAGAQTPPDSAALARRVAAVLDTGALARVHWGIALHDVATGRPLWGRNAERLFVPASNLKLVVAAAAAHHLGADYRYRTGFLAAGPVRDGVLEGDLVVYGRGDPTLSGRYQPDMLTLFRAVADSLRAHGVERITGGIVADVAHWPHEPQHGDWERYDLNWWYAAPTGPLGFNDNAIDFRVAPGEPGRPAAITWLPRSRSFTFSNRTRTVATGGEHTLDFDRVPGTDSIFAYGDIPVGRAPRTESFAVRDPALYAVTVLAETLVAAGIAVRPELARVVRGVAGARPLFELRSPPLPQLIGPVLQTSQNWFADQLLRTLGREVDGTGSWAAGSRVASRFLVEVVGLDTSAFRLRDGSGLSGANLVTPHLLAALAGWIAREPNQRVVLDALPVGAAATGSLRQRFPDLPGRVRAKTGSIRNVDALAGIVRTDSGREVAFSVVANGTGLPGARVRTAIDEVVRIVAREF